MAVPTKSAPGTLLDGSFWTIKPMLEVTSAEQPSAKGHRHSIFRRMLGCQKEEMAEASAQAEAPRPIEIRQKNTFVHFEDPKTPVGPPVFFAPDKTVFFAPPPSEENTGTASAEPAGQVAAEERAQLSNVVTCQRTGTASLGSEGHCRGQCIPCLMQVRWQAGKLAEPCKFGAQCGRCHEAHTEEELQKIQAKMRKQKKKHGASAAASLSSAFAKGSVAPVGAGAAPCARDHEI